MLRNAAARNRRLLCLRAAFAVFPRRNILESCPLVKQRGWLAEALKMPHKSFAEFAAQPDDRIELARGALMIAADEYPGLGIEAYLKRLDTLAAGVAECMPAKASPRKQVTVINHFLFSQRRFRGNTENYYDPRNSYLNEVIDRRIGIPITLSLIYIEIGRRLGIPIRGVGLPGHFIVKYDRPGHEMFIDPFRRGQILAAEDCHEIVLQASDRITSYGHFLEPISNRAILTRMLTNLKLIYIGQSDVARSIRVLDRLIQLNPGAIAEYKERGLLHLSGQCYRAALCDLITYMTNSSPTCPDATLIYEQIDHIITVLHETR